MNKPRPLWREFVDIWGLLPVLAFFALMLRLMGADWKSISGFLGIVTLLCVISWAIGTWIRRTGRHVPEMTGPIHDGSADPERLRLPRSAFLPTSGVARVVVLAIRTTQISILGGVALLVIRYLALPVYLPIYAPVAFVLVGGLEVIARAIAKKHRTASLPPADTHAG
jgi:hypothetical protein